MSIVVLLGDDPILKLRAVHKCGCFPRRPRVLLWNLHRLPNCSHDLNVTRRHSATMDEGNMPVRPIQLRLPSCPIVLPVELARFFAVLETSDAKDWRFKRVVADALLRLHYLQLHLLGAINQGHAHNSVLGAQL